MENNGIMYEQMRKLIDRMDLKIKGTSFKELLAVLKVKDKLLEDDGYRVSPF